MKHNLHQWIFVGVIVSIVFVPLSLVDPANVVSGHSFKETKVLFIIAFVGFQEDELEEPQWILEQAGFVCEIASDKTGIAKGADGTEISVEISLAEVNVDDYAAIVFVGGPGTKKHLWGNSDAIRIAKSAYEEGKCIGAICLAPGVLAEAGILEGKQATVYPTAKDKLEQAGATYIGQSVVIDDNIITANGPEAALKFGQAIRDQLLEVATEEETIVETIEEEGEEETIIAPASTLTFEGQFGIMIMVATILGLLIGIRTLNRKERK